MGVLIGAAGSMPLAGVTPKLYVAVKGVDTIDTLFMSAFDGTQWTPSSPADAAPLPGGGESATGAGLAVGVSTVEILGPFGQVSTEPVPYVVAAWATNNSLLYSASQGGTLMQGATTIPLGSSGGAVAGPALAVNSEGTTYYAAWPSPGGSVFNFKPLFLSSGNLPSPGTSTAINWNPPQEVPQAISADAPAIALLGDSLYVAWKNQGSQDLLVAHFLNGTWFTDKSIPGNSNCAPSLAVVDSRIVAAWVDVATDRIFVSMNIPWHENPLIAWSAPTPVGFENSNTPPLTKYGPSLAIFNGQLCLVWADISKTGGISEGPFGVVEWAIQNADLTWTYKGVVPGLWTGPVL